MTASRAAAGDVCAGKQKFWDLKATLSKGSYLDPCAAWKFARDVEAEVSPDQPSSFAVCDPDDFWARFREAVLAHLGSDADNRAALRAARDLRRSGARFAAQDLELDSGPTTAAQYYFRDRRIELDYRLLQTLWKSRFPGLPGDEEIQRAADEQASHIVHEISHARLHLEMGRRLWSPYAEDELVPYAEEAAYMMYRLRREPDALRLRCLDEQYTGRLGSTWTARGWWLAPLSLEDGRRASAFTDEVRGFCGASRTGTNLWYVLRSFAGGFRALEKNLADLPGFHLPKRSVFAPAEEFRGPARARFSARREALAACRARAEAGGHAKYLASELEVLEARFAFYASDKGLARLRRRHRKAMRALEDDLVRLRAAEFEGP